MVKIRYTGKVVEDDFRVLENKAMATMTMGYCGLVAGRRYPIMALNDRGDAIVEPDHPTPGRGWPCPELGQAPNYLFVGPDMFVMGGPAPCPMEVQHV